MAEHDPILEAVVKRAALQWRFNMNPPDEPTARNVMLLFSFESDERADDTPAAVFELPWNVYIRAPRDAYARTSDPNTKPL